tara:strand:- start:50 stop:418 length:369 start_codon:yes stop_codon:yes gene_type:complete
MLAASIIYMGHPDHGWILGGVEDKIPAIRHCYERARLTNPEADGRRIAVLEIDDIRKVRNVRFRDQDFSDATMEECVTAAVESIPYPRRPGPKLLVVTLPLRFHHAESMKEATIDHRQRTEQ